MMEMTETTQAPRILSASDVVLDIVDSDSRIEGVTAVIYSEGPNWRDITQTTEAGLKLGIKQDFNPRKLVKLSRGELMVGKLLEMQRGLSPHQLIGITSKVSAGPEARHIPMMDFKCEVSDRNLRVLGDLLRESCVRIGFILTSGRSYHFYGRELLTEESWRKFLGKCLLMSDFVDERYVGHQLVDGYCVLRVSASSMKPTLPRVVARIGD